MKSYILFSALALAAICPYGSRAQGAVGPTEYVMCRARKTVRTIRVVNKDDGCQTVYTKLGVDKVVGSAKGQSSCQHILNNIRTNLEGASWKCKDVGAATFTVNH